MPRSPSDREVIGWGVGQEAVYWVVTFVLVIGAAAWSFIISGILLLSFGVAYFSWVRTESMYRCSKCDKAWAFIYVRAAGVKCNA